MKNKKVLLIGALNTGKRPNGGEEYKNRILRQVLEVQYSLKIIDTHSWRSDPKILVSLLINIFLLRYDAIIISASSLSSYRLIKIINIFPSILNKTIYLVIGGYFPEAISNGRYKKKYYYGLKQIVVEGESLRSALAKADLSKNVSVIPNFKPVEKTYLKSINKETGTIKFVFLSSISASKGVDILLNAVKILLSTGNKQFKVDFWGPLEDVYKSHFYAQMEKVSDFCSYRGYIDILAEPELSYKELSSYDCMIFPTYYEGEGFPGVILDAYIAGLPVIASDWNMNREVVIDGITGFIIPPKDKVSLAKCMEYLIEDSTILITMRTNCNAEALKYDSEYIFCHKIKPIIDRE